MPATVWKGHLSFGLISIPVRLYRAARAERIALHQLARAVSPPAPASPPPRSPPAGRGKVVQMPSRPAEPSGGEKPAVERIRQAAITESQEQPIPPGELVKGYETGEGEWVLLDKEDLKRIAPATSKVIVIREFVRFTEIDPVYLESSYYVAPEKTGEKAYALLYKALREAGYAALGEIAMHKREHVLVLRPGRTGMVAHTMFYPDEVRADEEYRADLSLVIRKEFELAVQFVQALAGKFEPEKYKDTYRERLAALIDAKARGGEVAREVAAPAPRTEVVDLMEALKKSLDLTREPAARKPTAKEEAAPPAPKKHTPRRGG